MDSYPVDRLACRYEPVGQVRWLEVEQDVVDDPSVAVLDHLDGRDVGAGFAEGGGDSAERPRNVGQLDAQKEGHTGIVVLICVRHVKARRLDGQPLRRLERRGGVTVREQPKGGAES